MDAMNYDAWAVRINQAIRGKRRSGEGEGECGESPPEKEMLLAFASEAEAIVAAVNRHVEIVQVQGGGRLDSLGGFLDEMMKFDEFSMLEYRYRVPGNRQPGLRFKVRKKGEGWEISVISFEDLVFWEVDEEGQRVFTEPIRFEFSEGSIRAVPNFDQIRSYEGCGTWQEALRETLAMPFKEHYDA